MSKILVCESISGTVKSKTSSIGSAYPPKEGGTAVPAVNDRRDACPALASVGNARHSVSVRQLPPRPADTAPGLPPATPWLSRARPTGADLVATTKPRAPAIIRLGLARTRHPARPDGSRCRNKPTEFASYARARVAVPSGDQDSHGRWDTHVRAAARVGRGAHRATCAKGSVSVPCRRRPATGCAPGSAGHAIRRYCPGFPACSVSHFWIPALSLRVYRPEGNAGRAKRQARCLSHVGARREREASCFGAPPFWARVAFPCITFQILINWPPWGVRPRHCSGPAVPEIGSVPCALACD